jgi:predicted type IV restriction endonuclease
MVQIAAKEVTLKQLRQSVDLKVTRDASFFTEWQNPDDRLSPSERELLDRVQDNFTALMDDPPMLENTVKMVILAPLLDLAGFYRQPFQLETESSAEITANDGDTVIRGRIDVLVLKQKFWLLVIESKRSDFSVTRALPQALAYMLGSPNRDQPTFGMITNGNEFLFVKSIGPPTAQYATSRLFSLINPGNELAAVLNILKTIGQIAVA